MRSFITLSLLLFGLHLAVSAQTMFSTNIAHTTFYSSTPIEDISAVNKKVQVMLVPEKKQIAVQMEMQEFTFENGLMQEHFNENYMESEKYPKAKFSGLIQEGIDFSKTGSYDISAIGILEIHGVKQERTLTGKLEVFKDYLDLTCNFTVLLEDHNIEVPKVVFANIAQEIEVKAFYQLYPYSPEKVE